MSQPPAGTVTLLFMDIEGSTPLMQQLGHDYSQLLTTYLRLIRAALADHNGCEVNIQDDSVFAVFERATDAVQAAVALQRAFAVQSWPQDVPVAVRMGLHTGDPLIVEGQYVGMDVQRAATIGKAGHGGQILLSLTTQTLVEDNPPPGVNIRPLGDHRLNDLGQPQLLFQLVIEGLPADFPPLRSLGRVPNNLPIQPTVLIGREADVAALRDLLLSSDARLITLTGFGGVGKTRLSLQVAADCLDRFPDGVYFVPLAALRDPALVPEALHKTLGLAEAAGKPLLAVVVDALRTRQVLIVLDNFEQVIEAQTVVSRMLSACPQVKFIVT
ncbi:MAG: adenylate/guanylate cyclase domain-containing protein, partial [Anaerolineae bacterium]|nr:adenylate/guanylate cyclase domain-containing protein [Anaerolineae bacterium]